MSVVVLRTFTASGSGNLSGRIVRTLYGDILIPPEDPSVDGSSNGAVSVWGLASIVWAMEAPVIASSLGSTTYAVGVRVTATGPDGVPVVATDRDNYTVTTTKVVADESRSGTWSFTAEVELCEETTLPTIPSGVGAGSYVPDPPKGRTKRIFLRRKNGGAWSISATMGGATASRAGTFGSAAELPYPDGIDLSVHADAQSIAAGGGLSLAAATTGAWRGSSIAADRTATSSHGSASATAAGGCSVTATAADDPVSDSAAADASMSVAVKAEWSLDTLLRAMGVNYPDGVTIVYTHSLGTHEHVVGAGGSHSTSGTYRSESSAVSVTGDGFVEDAETYAHPSNFGPIAVAVKAASASPLSEPLTDLDYLLRGRAMPALRVTCPADSGNLTGTDTALAGTPWGVKRDWSLVAPNWRGLMGWAYLRVQADETGGGAAGAAVTIRIGSKTWTKDRAGVALTTPGSGASATWEIDLCAPTSETAATDAQDTTYPYAQDWTADGGDEDSYPRAGNGPYVGVLSAVDMRVEVGSACTLTLTSVKGVRNAATTYYATNLPSHRAWFQQRPDTVVSEADTTTTHKARHCFFAALEGRQDALEWSDVEWNTTTGGVSGVVTHVVAERSIAWLAARVNAARLAPGYTATVDAPAPGTGLEAYFNRDREMWGIMGGGVRWERPSVSYPAGRWAFGIDEPIHTSGDGAIQMPWQDAYTTLTTLPGNVGDIHHHAADLTTGPTVLKAALIWRCDASGLSLDTAHARSAGDTLSMTQGGVARGTGTTDADGYARTGTPYGRGDGGSCAVKVAASPEGYYPPTSRKRHRFRARVVEEAEGDCCPWIVCDDAGFVWRAFVADANANGAGRIDVWSNFLAPRPGASWTGRVTAIAGDRWADPRICVDPNGRLDLVVVKLNDKDDPAAGGDAWRTWSDDEGKTWGEPVMAIAGANHATISVHPDWGERIVAGTVVDGGSRKIKAAFKRRGEAWSAPFFFLDDTGAALVVDDAQFHVVPLHDGTARWLLSVRINGESAISEWVSADDTPTTWKRSW